MKRATHELRRVLKVNGVSVFLFEIIYKLAMTLILTNVTYRAVSYALKLRGFSYLTTANAGAFFAAPATLLILALVVLLAFLLCSIEVSALFTAFQASVGKQRLGAAGILIFGIRNYLELFKTGNRKTVLLCINFYVAAGSWILIRLVEHTRPLSYIISELSSYLWVRIIYISVITLMSIYALTHIFVVSLSILRDTSYRDSCEENKKLMKKHWIPVILGVLLLNALTFAFYELTQLLFKVIAAMLVILLADRSKVLALILTLSTTLDVAALILTAIFSVTMHIGFITMLQYRFQHQKYLLEIPNYRTLIPEKVRKTGTAAAMTALIGLTAWYLYAAFVSGNIYSPETNIQITSHRGNSYEAPENTLPAIEAAVESLSDYVEIDVQETKDGTLVVFHDSTLKRITGQSGRIREYTYLELLAFDFGGWFSEEYENTKIPTLAEVLESCKGRINLNIELKSSGFSESLAENTLEMIREYDMGEQVVISSSNYKYLKLVKELEPDLPTGYILSAAYGNYFTDENVDFFSIRSAFVTERLVKSAHENGKLVHVWTVNSKAELNRLKRLQVDNIITDRPVLAREMLYREEDTESMVEFLKLALRRNN